MSLSFKVILIVFVTAVLASCATKPTVRTAVDSAADLKSYQSFGFAVPFGTDRSGYSTIVSQQLKAAARRELSARGYTYTEEAPQLLVNFNASLDDKLRVNTTPTASVAVGRGYYGYRSGFYTAWPAYRTDVSQYTQGTLNIDVIDRAQKRLLWEGVAVGRVTAKKKEDLSRKIDAAVVEIFKRFPVAPKS